jgi:hypothetical protein
MLARVSKEEAKVIDPKELGGERLRFVDELVEGLFFGELIDADLPGVHLPTEPNLSSE